MSGLNPHFQKLLALISKDLAGTTIDILHHPGTAVRGAHQVILDRYGVFVVRSSQEPLVIPKSAKAVFGIVVQGVTFRVPGKYLQGTPRQRRKRRIRDW